MNNNLVTVHSCCGAQPGQCQCGGSNPMTLNQEIVNLIASRDDADDILPPTPPAFEVNCGCVDSDPDSPLPEPDWNQVYSDIASEGRTPKAEVQRQQLAKGITVSEVDGGEGLPELVYNWKEIAKGIR